MKLEIRIWKLENNNLKKKKKEIRSVKTEMENEKKITSFEDMEVYKLARKLRKN